MGWLLSPALETKRWSPLKTDGLFSATPLTYSKVHVIQSRKLLLPHQNLQQWPCTHLQNKESLVCSVLCHGLVLQVVFLDVDFHLELLQVKQQLEAPTIVLHGQWALKKGPGWIPENPSLFPLFPLVTGKKAINCRKCVTAYIKLQHQPLILHKGNIKTSW